MELVLDAFENENYKMLDQIATKEAIRSLGYLLDQLPYPIVQVYSTEWKHEYNYRVELSNDQYFDVYLEFGKWPDCPVEIFTDDEVIAHYHLIRVGEFIQP